MGSKTLIGGDSQGGIIPVCEASFLVLQLEGFCVEGLSLLAREFKGHSKPELTSQGKSQKNKY